MVELDQEQQISQPTAENVPSMGKDLLSDTMKRTSEWIFSQEIPSDVTVVAGEASFSLHKFPLVSKSGFIRKLVSESTDADLSVIEIPDVPGGADAFELAAKFCYGINFEINVENIAMLRCVAEFLEMTDDYMVGNLIGRTEAYINEAALTNLAGAVFILRSCENLLPIAEKVKLVNRCVDTIAYVICKDSQLGAPAKGEAGVYDSVSSAVPVPRNFVDWWAEDLTALGIDFFRMVVAAMMARGFKKAGLGPMLMLYAQKSLRGLEIFGKGRMKIDVVQEHEKRVVLETIVGLLPREKNTIPVSFLSMMLRAAICLDTTVSCRLDLEMMIASQLAQAVIDDLLIPCYSFKGETLFDVETVQRIMIDFLDSEFEANELGFDSGGGLTPHSSNHMEIVERLMECFLAEIASDRNLCLPKFINFAEIIPEQARITDDGMYRAIDIYLKAHPGLSDTERKDICSLMNCQKLSREARAHAAQNERLPSQTLVQVLYHEQQGGSMNESPTFPAKNQLSDYLSSQDSDNISISNLQRENQDLKLELTKMRLRLKDMEKPSLSQSHVAAGNNTSASGISRTMSIAEKPGLPRKSFISSVSKKLGRFMRAEGSTPESRGRNKSGKGRRHSIS